MKTLTSVLGLSALLLVGGVWAQEGVWFGGAGYHSSTAEEGAARGMADLTRSMGAANLMNSEAAKNWGDAQRTGIENRVYGTEAYFDMRRINREARDAERRPRPTQDDLARFARARLPNRLSVSDLDPLTGQIDWPITLRGDQYAESREVIDALFQTRAKDGYLSAARRSELRIAADAMQAQLLSNIRDYAPQDYTQARQFIQSLTFELSAQG